MAKSVNPACFSLIKDKTESRKAHKHAASEGSCREGLAKHLKGWKMEKSLPSGALGYVSTVNLFILHGRVFFFCAFSVALFLCKFVGSYYWMFFASIQVSHQCTFTFTTRKAVCIFCVFNAASVH